MKWSAQQESALAAINNWLNSSNQLFKLFGYAGTGKTTLAKTIAEGVEGGVIFAAFTGKAAYVLQKKGCEGARTIHSLIYISRDKGKAKLRELQSSLEILKKQLQSEGLDSDSVNRHSRVVQITRMINDEEEALKQPFFILNTDSDIKEATLVIIDECSMIDMRMGEDLMSFGVKILVLGDPAQLPPIMGAGYFTHEKVDGRMVDKKPDFMLTDIHRQARNSPILRMATEVRNKRKLTIQNYGEGCQVVSNEKLTPEFALDFNQILVGRNKTKFATNKRIRQLRGYEGLMPLAGDRIICERNDHEQGLLNGSIYSISSVSGVLNQKIMMDIIPEGEESTQSIIAHEHAFLGKKGDLPWYEKREAQEFDYGYAMTVHKSQGSQWNKVLLLDESNCFRKDKWKWLYTGITRAADELTIVEM